jgi:hypothetical protein
VRREPVQVRRGLALEDDAVDELGADALEADAAGLGDVAEQRPVVEGAVLEPTGERPDGALGEEDDALLVAFAVDSDRRRGFVVVLEVEERDLRAPQPEAVQEREDGGVPGAGGAVVVDGAALEDGAELVGEDGAAAGLAFAFDGPNVEGTGDGLLVDEFEAPAGLEDGADGGEVAIGGGVRVKLLQAASERADVLGA